MIMWINRLSKTAMTRLSQVGFHTLKGTNERGKIEVYKDVLIALYQCSRNKKKCQIGNYKDSMRRLDLISNLKNVIVKNI